MSSRPPCHVHRNTTCKLLYESGCDDSGSSSRDFVQESLWQDLYKWYPYDMDISRIRFLEGIRL
jgi:hypothetical protein